MVAKKRKKSVKQGVAAKSKATDRNVTKRKRAQNVMEEKHRLNKLLLDSLPHIAMLIRKDRTVLAANRLARDAGAKVGGYCWRDFAKSDFIPEEDKKHIAEYKKAPPGGTHCYFCLADEALKSQKPARNPEFNAWGKIWDAHWVPLDEQTYLHYAIDITERKRAEQALRDSEEKYRILAEGTNDIPYLATLEGIATYVGPQIARYGLSVQEVVSRNFLEFVSPEDRDRVARDFQETMTTGREFPTEFRLKDKEGRIHWLEDYGRVQRDESGKIVGLSGVLRDITDHKLAEQALHESETRYKTMFDSSPDGIIIADVKTREFQYANQTVCRMVGYSKEELTSMRVDDIHPKEALERVISEFEAQARGEKTLAEDIPCLRKDGTLLYADINTVEALVDGRKCNIGFFRDITERKEAEKALSEKNIALREVLDGIQEQKNEMGRTILSNVDKIIMPLIHVLELGLPRGQQRYMDLLKQSLQGITSPFVSTLLTKVAGLTPTEIRMCDLIRRGLSNKEIAQLEHSSAATVNKHRARIRRKLGITNRKVNLAAHLQSFMPGQEES